MNKFTLRTCVALACAIGVAGCGGGNDNVALQVQITSGIMAGMTLQNKDGAIQTVPAGTTLFTFPDLVSEDTSYDIQIRHQPSNALCTMEGGSGKTGAYSPNNIIARCVIYTYDVGGTISNLTSDGLILSNGSVKKAISPTSTVLGNVRAFDLTTPAVPATTTTPAVAETGKVAEGFPYGVLIYQQPAQGGCSIDINPATGASTGVGTMPNKAVDTIIIKC
jgi:hypothetical protein